MTKFKLRKKDKVVVITGRDRGKTGEILKIFPAEGRVLVSKVNVVTKHKKRTQNEPGGLQKLEAPLDYSNVMLLCPKCDKPTRPVLEKLQTGETVRKCRRCAETIL